MKKVITFLILLSISFSSLSPFLAINLEHARAQTVTGVTNNLPTDKTDNTANTQTGSVPFSDARYSAQNNITIPGPSRQCAGGEMPRMNIDTNVATCYVVATGNQGERSVSMPAGTPSPPDTSTPCKYEGNIISNPAGFLDGMFCDAIRLILLKLASAGLYLSAKSFDFIVNLSLFTINNKLASNDNQIYQLWSVSRDLGNIVGLFLFFLSAIPMIFGFSEGIGARKYITKLIMFAILMNFSYPITKSVIDFTNVFALNVYGMATSQDGVNYNYQGNPANKGWLINDYGFSYQFMQLLGIQRVNDDLSSIDISNTAGGKVVQKGIAGVNSSGSMLVLVLITAASAIIFAQAAMVFLTRTVLMFICIISSPIMFLGGILPPNKYFNIDDWVNTWMKRFVAGALVAPVMIICVWISMRLISFTMGISNDPSTPAQMFLMVLSLLAFQKLIGFSASMLDDLGEKAAAIGGKLGGRMMNATGRMGAGITRNTIGRGLGKMLPNEATRTWLKAGADNGSRMAKMALTSTDYARDKLRSASFNPMSTIGKGVGLIGGKEMSGLIASGAGNLQSDDAAIAIAKSKVMEFGAKSAKAKAARENVKAQDAYEESKSIGEVKRGQEKQLLALEDEDKENSTELSALNSTLKTNLENAELKEIKEKLKAAQDEVAILGKGGTPIQIDQAKKKVDGLEKDLKAKESDLSINDLQKKISDLEEAKSRNKIKINETAEALGKSELAIQKAKETMVAAGKAKEKAEQVAQSRSEKAATPIAGLDIGKARKVYQQYKRDDTNANVGNSVTGKELVGLTGAVVGTALPMVSKLEMQKRKEKEAASETKEKKESEKQNNALLKEILKALKEKDKK